jgi:hypothetical protein
LQHSSPSTTRSLPEDAELAWREFLRLTGGPGPPE